MAIEGPISDLARSVQHEPNRDYPAIVKVSLQWDVGGGHIAISSATITADEFFGLGQSGAPLDGASVIAMIERLRRAGPPPGQRHRPDRKANR
jgi:hypothetical protein